MNSNLRRDLTWYFDRLRLIKNNVGQRWSLGDESVLVDIADTLHIADDFDFDAEFIQGLMERAQAVMNNYETGHEEMKY
jgi:hypothetical protein